MRSSAAAIACATALAACGQGGSSGPSGAGSACANAGSSGEVQVQGTVGGQTVGVDESPASGEFVQFPSGTFDTPVGVTVDDASVAVTPTVVQVHLTWSGIVPNGAPATAMGSITLPQGQPYGQMTLCAGSGSTITPTSQGLDFDLKGLMQGSDCAVAVGGELHGCWGWSNDQ